MGVDFDGGLNQNSDRNDEAMSGGIDRTSLRASINECFPATESRLYNLHKYKKI